MTLRLYSRDAKSKSIINEKWRNLVAEYVKDGRIKLDICEIDSMFLASTIEVLSSLNKSSASNSVILFGALKLPLHTRAANNEVVGKIFFSPKHLKRSDNSLLVEMHVYKEIVSNLLNMHVTPHLMRYIGYAKCDITQCVNTSQVLNSVIKEANESIGSKHPHVYQFHKMHMLLTERSKGRKLTDYIYKTNMSWKQWHAILFQLIFTIQCFVEIKFMHNDLHSGNIFIDSIPKTTFLYFVRFKNNITRVFKVTTEYFLRIYDFDFATFNKKSPFIQKFLTIGKNTKLNSDRYICLKMGICESVNWYTDLFRILTSISNANSPKELESWLNKYADITLLRNENKIFAKKGVMCKVKFNSSQCEKISPSIRELKNPLYILEKGFQDYELTDSINSTKVAHFQPHVYATPNSRVTFPPTSKKDYQVHLNQLKSSASK